MGVFVDVLISRGSFLRILLLCLTLGVFACSEPDERLPWPTGDDDEGDKVETKVEMPDETVGEWVSPCMDILGDSRVFTVVMKKNGEFIAIESRHYGSGCSGSANNDSRTRKGKVDAFEVLSPDSLKITAHIYNSYIKNIGDLMTADVILKMKNSNAHIKPLSADLHSIADKKQHLTWDDDDDEEWVLSPN